MSARLPWGAGRAPALRCDDCGRPIAKQRPHIITESRHLLCLSCFSPWAGSGPVLAKYYPNCDVDWHDMYDHGSSNASRAAAWCVLDDPEGRRVR